MTFALWLAVIAAELLALAGAVRMSRLLSRFGSGGDPSKQALCAPDRPVRLRADVRPLVLLIALAVAVDLLVAAGDCAVLGTPGPLGAVLPCRAPAPRSGLVSAVVLVEQALTAAWPAALAAAAWRVFIPAGPPSKFRVCESKTGKVVLTAALFVLPWALLVAVLVIGRPYGHPGADPAARAARAEVVARLLHGWECLCVAAGLAAVWRAWRPELEWSRSPAHRAVVVLLVLEGFVTIVGPFVRDPFAEWDAARALYVVGFGAAAVIFWRGVRAPRTDPT